MSYVLGVDAGNTKTIAVLARIDGTILGAGRGGCGDIYGAGSPEAALAAVDTALVAALRQAGAQTKDVMSAAFSMAGADWPEDFSLLQDAMRGRGFNRPLVVNDAMGALRAGTEDYTGVAVVCGTGAAIGARSANGRAWHTSHWQEPHGSHELGRKTLRAVYRAELGIDPPTSLSERVSLHFGGHAVEDILHLFTGRDTQRPTTVAELARALMEEAASGDATACRIVEAHGSALGDYALAAARRVGIEGAAYTLLLAGSVLRGSTPLLAEAIIARVHERSPQARPAQTRFEPVIGAVLLAIEQAGIVVNSAIVMRIAASLPPLGLFAT